MEQPIIKIDNFSGGITLSKRLGKDNQFCFGHNLDFTSDPGYLTVGPAWYNVQDAGGGNFSTTEFVEIVYCIKDGNTYLFGDNKKIYYLDSDGNVAVANEDTSLGNFKGAVEFNGYLVYTHRVDASNIYIGTKDLSQAYNAGYNHTFKSGLSDADYLPLFPVGDTLYFGNGQYVGKITDITSSSSVTTNALDLADNWQIRDIDSFGIRYLAIAANYYTSTNRPAKAKIFLWDMSSSSWNDEIIVPESEIKAIKFEGGYLWIWAGKSCNIYAVHETSRTPIKIWQFSREDPTQDLEVYPGAVISRRGTIFFGLSGEQTWPTGVNRRYYRGLTGIYSFPANPNRFSLNIPFYESGYNEDYKAIGVVRDEGDNKLYFSFDDSLGTIWLKREKTKSNELHYSDTGEFESFVYEAPKNKKIVTEAFGIYCDPLPAGCNIDMLYRTEDEQNQSVFSGFSTENATKKIVRKRVEARSLQIILKIRGTNTGTNYTYRPFIKSIFVTGHLEDVSD